MSVLITGGSGILGSELKKKFPNALTPTHEELDISDRSSVNDFFNKNEFDIIIHTAAMTSVRKCEEEKDHTWKINKGFHVFQAKHLPWHRYPCSSSQ